MKLYPIKSAQEMEKEVLKRANRLNVWWIMLAGALLWGGIDILLELQENSGASPGIETVDRWSW